MSLDAWWIIVLPDTKLQLQDTLCGTLEKNLCRWSITSGFMNSSKSPRWWHIDRPELKLPENEGVLVESLKTLIINPLKGTSSGRPLLGGDIRPGMLNVAIIGNIMDDTVRAYLHTLGKMLRHVQGQLFPDVTLSINGIAFLSTVPAEEDDSKSALLKFLSELSTMMEDELIPNRPFDHFFVVQEQNNVPGNDNGYLGLEPQQIADLIAQSVFHLMIGDNSVLTYVKENHRANYLSIGSAGLFHDSEQLRIELGAELGRSLLDKFKNGLQKPYVNEKLAGGLLAGIADRFNIETLFRRLTSGEGMPSFMFNSRIWEGAKDSQGKSVSAWAMYRKELLYIYFLKYLRNLPVRLTEYTRMYLTISIQKFRDHLAVRKKAMLEGGGETQEPGLRETLVDKAGEILKGKHGDARTLGQIEMFTRLVRDMCDVEGLNSRLLRIEGFRDLKVFQVPDYLKEFFDLTPERLDPETEKANYKRIVDTIRSHPVPTALLIRTILLSVLTVFTGFYVARLLSPNVVNLQWFLDTPCVTLVLLFIAPFALAFWRYKVRTLNLLWKDIKKYVASVLKHAESHSKDLVAATIGEVYREVHKSCDEIDAHCRMLRERLKYSDERPEGYAETGFLFSILGEKNIPGKERLIRPFGAKPEFHLKTSDIDKTLEKLNDDETNRLIGIALDSTRLPQEDGQPFSGLLGDTILENITDETFNDLADGYARFCTEQYSSVPATLHALVANYLEPDHAKVEKLEDGLKTLTFPPLVLSISAQGGKTVFEAKCDTDGKDVVSGLLGSAEISGIKSPSLLSIAGLRPVTRLEDIASIMALRETIDPDGISWNDAAAIFTMAVTGQECDSQGIRWLFDGNYIAMEKEALSRMKALKKILVQNAHNDQFYQEDM